MIENAYENLKLRLLVDWGVILLGARGAFAWDVGRLNPKIIEEFASSQLATIEPCDPEFEDVAALALDSNLPRDDIERMLCNICRIKNLDIEFSKRKWRVALVEDALSEVDSNPMYGSIQLSEIWSRLGWPDDAPQSMRSSSNAFSNGDFGSLEWFEMVKQEVMDWVASEYAAIR